MSYTVRLSSPEDLPQVAGLITRLWFRDPAVNERYLAWRYRHNPCPESLMAVVEHQGRIVAARGAYGMRWRAGDAVLTMPCMGDTVVDEHHEGKRLVQGLTRCLLESLSGQGIDWVVNQSPGPVVERISLRTGWRRVGEWTVAKLVNGDRSAARDFGRFDEASARPVERDGVRITAGPLDAAALAGLAARTTRGHIGHLRDEAYFQWRFDNPIGDYRWLYARTDEPAGYLVLGRAAAHPWRMRILDLQGTDGRIQALLLDQALRWGGFREVRIWWNRFPRDVSRLLAERGFAQVSDETRRRAMPLVAPTGAGRHDFSVNGIDLLSPASWDPRMIHSDAT